MGSVGSVGMSASVVANAGEEDDLMARLNALSGDSPVRVVKVEE